MLSAVGMDGVKVAYTYNSFGQPLTSTVSDASGENTSTTTYTYTEYSNYLASVTEPTGAVTSYQYDEARGLVTRITDPNGNITDYEYDPNTDALVSVSNPQIEGVPETTIEYSSDNRYWQIDNVMNVYYACYDQFGRLEMTATDDITSLIYNTYDADGNLAAQFIGSYDVVDFTYDDDNRVKSVAYNDELNYEYDYTSSGQLGRLTDHDNGVEWSYRYDLAGRPTEVFADDGRSFKYEYNDKNAVGSFKATDGNTTLLETEYSYDQYSRAAGVEISSMAGSPTQSYTYDSLGRTSSVTSQYSDTGTISQNYTYIVNNGNQTGLVETISYTKNGEAVLPTLRYEYDAKGNITRIYENEVLKVTYAYDELNRLVSETNGFINKIVYYYYDKYGNMLEKEVCPDSYEFEYNSPSSGNAVSKYGNYTMTYDEIGNPVSYKGYSMVWTKAKQLAALSGEQLTMSFKYDSNGIRTLKRVNGVDTEFTYAGTTLVSQKTGDEIINFAYTAGGAPYGFTYNSTNYFYLLNLQGDVIGIYDSNGDVVVKYTYDTWGQLMSITGTLADTIGVKNPLRYRGYYYDTETKLYYLQSRYYDPETCHFISMDSYFVAGDYINGMNMYAYCLNNPVMYVDPTGMASETDISGWLGGLWLFAEMCYYFGLENWIPGLSDMSGEIVDFEVAIYDEFSIGDGVAGAINFVNDLAVGAAVGAIVSSFMGSGVIAGVFTKLEKWIPGVAAGVSALSETKLSEIFGSLNIFSNVAPGRYVLMSFLFMEEGKKHEYIPHIYYVLKFLGPDIEEGERITKDMQTDSSLEFMIYQIGFN